MPGPGPPDAAHELFAGALPVAERYAELLAGPGVVRGLIGPAEAERLWDRHLLNCAVIAGLIPPRGALLDIGSGAGLPGLVLAMLLPDVKVTLLEPMARRTAFLEECVQALDLRNVVVRRGRAEELAGRVGADVVTARAVAPLRRLAALAVGLARSDGLVLAIKGAGAAAELAAARPVLRALGVTDVDLVTAGAGLLETPATVVRFRTPQHAIHAGLDRGNARQAPAALRDSRGARGGTAGRPTPAADSPRSPRSAHGGTRGR